MLAMLAICFQVGHVLAMLAGAQVGYLLAMLAICF
jgi:hypothetical protein